MILKSAGQFTAIRLKNDKMIVFGVSRNDIPRITYLIQKEYYIQDGEILDISDNYIKYNKEDKKYIVEYEFVNGIADCIIIDKIQL